MDFKEKCFEIIFEAMLSSGGDGNSILCCDKWENTANEFEIWLAKNHQNFLHRNNQEKSVVFGANQESVTISHLDTEHNSFHFTECYLRTMLF